MNIAHKTWGVFRNLLSLSIHIFAVRSFLCFLLVVVVVCVCVCDQDATRLRLFIAIVYCIHVLFENRIKTHVRCNGSRYLTAICVRMWSNRWNRQTAYTMHKINCTKSQRNLENHRHIIKRSPLIIVFLWQYLWSLLSNEHTKNTLRLIEKATRWKEKKHTSAICYLRYGLFVLMCHLLDGFTAIGFRNSMCNVLRYDEKVDFCMWRSERSGPKGHHYFAFGDLMKLREIETKNKHTNKCTYKYERNAIGVSVRFMEIVNLLMMSQLLANLKDFHWKLPMGHLTFDSTEKIDLNGSNAAK